MDFLDYFWGIHTLIIDLGSLDDRIIWISKVVNDALQDLFSVCLMNHLLYVQGEAKEIVANPANNIYICVTREQKNQAKGISNSYIDVAIKRLTSIGIFRDISNDSGWEKEQPSK